MKVAKPVLCLISLLSVGQVFAAPPAAPAAPAAAKPAEAPKYDLRISSIDGVVNPLHKKEILRRAGKKVTLTADLFVKENGKLVPQNIRPEEFRWEISTYVGQCDPARASSCKGRGMEVTKDGISFKTNSGSYGIVDEFAENMTVKVTYAKDKNRKDSLIIVNQTEKERLAQAEKDMAEQAAQEEANRPGFWSTFFGSSSSSNDTVTHGSDDCSPYDATPSCGDSRGYGRGGHHGGGFGGRHGGGNFGGRGHDRDGDGRPDWRGRDHDGRGNDGRGWNRPDPTPAPTPVTPTPSYTPDRDRDHGRGGNGGFGGRGGEGRGEGRGGFGGRDRDSTPSPVAPAVDNSAAIREAMEARMRAAQEAQAAQAAQAAAAQQAMQERMRQIQEQQAAALQAAQAAREQMMQRLQQGHGGAGMPAGGMMGFPGRR